MSGESSIEDFKKECPVCGKDYEVAVKTDVNKVCNLLGVNDDRDGHKHRGVMYVH